MWNDQKESKWTQNGPKWSKTCYIDHLGSFLALLDRFGTSASLPCSAIFSCPGQLNRWHCHSLSEWVTLFDFSVFRALQSSHRHMWPFWQRRTQWLWERLSDFVTPLTFPWHQSQFLRCFLLNIMGNLNCIEKSSQSLVSVPFWCWCLIIELLTDFLANWFKKKVESLIQFIRRRNRLHVWFLSLTERLSHHSYFYTESCNRVCNFKNIFRIFFFCAECKI